MPHPDAEHGLRVQLATALRERDTEREFRGAAEAAFGEQLARTEATESERDDLRAEVKRLREALETVAAECSAQDDNFARCDQTTHKIARAALASGGDDAGT